ncbi:MAG: histidine phosphatase family protein [Pseudomonadota bacterium]
MRHTRPDIDSDVCYGQLDVDVKPSFAEEASDVITRVDPPDLIVSSPLRRCKKLAVFIAQNFGCDYLTDQRLSEMDFGSWEGQPWGDLPREELDAWAEDFLHAAPHGGESVQALNDRVAARLNEDRGANRSVLWVTHAGVLKSARFLVAENPSTFDWQVTMGFGQTFKLY